MVDRRDFLKDLAGAGGLAFVGCGLAAAPAPARTVDAHAHCVVPQAVALMKQALPQQPQLLLEGQGLADRLRDMDAQGIDFAVLSINPNWYETDRDMAAALITIQNEALAQFCASHQDRFAALASVALQFPDLAAEQLERAVRTMGLRGAAIGGSVVGQELSNPKFHPFFAKAEELGVVVFIHPQPSTVLNDRLKGNGPLNGTVWYPLETTLALTHLIWDGTLDRFPSLKILAAHGGGYLPSYIHRADHGCTISPNQCQPGVPKMQPSAYLRQLYFDSLVFTPEALRHLVAEVGADRIVVGTDYPFPWVTEPIDHVLRTAGLNDAQKEAILGATATRLLGLKSTSTGP
jgi:aminocarboxymuconate-semialdehyde decarboxylase